MNRAEHIRWLIHCVRRRARWWLKELACSPEHGPTLFHAQLPSWRMGNSGPFWQSAELCELETALCAAL